MLYYKQKLGKTEFENHQTKINLGSSLFACCLAAALTNPLECITVNKQTKTDFNIMKFVRE